ncbi:MAG TPA: hypothetical protein VHV47_14185 [Opitutaceae bacterium]|jgi:hypothetical protein|nr:hypothetical protein [Opitutaceae bacterium]
MSLRLTSFLSAIEDALQGDTTLRQGGTWDHNRAVNYHLGLARLNLAVRKGQSVQPMGTILVQAFDLADNKVCLKANLSWAGRNDGAEIAYSIYQRPGVDWAAEAAQVATAFQAGPPAAPEKIELAAVAETTTEPALAVAS